jgi:hydroxypyruvate reductase
MASNLRKDALTILRTALEAADPFQAILRHVSVNDQTLIVGRRRYRLDGIDQVYVLGAGKASATMARALERLLGGRITGGLVNVKYGHVAKVRRVTLNECGHPVPDEAGVAGARRIADLASQAGERDLVLCVFSGGGSALMPLPAAPITLAEKQETTKLLLACGASIHEINAVRKHVSDIKGGQLARLAYPANVISLLLSDVVGDDLDVIGSGPTAADSSTFARAKSILEKYGILERVPASVRDRIGRGIAGEIPETPKPGEAEMERTQNLVVGSNQLAVDAAAGKARELGYRTIVLSTFIEGETRDVGRLHAAVAKEIRSYGRPLKPPACVISGGETTVTIRGEGLGGRNQEFVLAAAIDLAGMENVLVLSAGTDGTDGPTDAAGAVADGETVDHGRRRGLDAVRALASNDSYRFFEPLGKLVKTGPTNTNVMDVRILLVG